MIYTVKENPAPENGSDLTGRKPSQKECRMVAFRRKRKSSARKNKGRTRRTVRRASTRKRKRANPKRRRSVSRGTHRPRPSYNDGKWYGGKSSKALIPRGSNTRVNPRRKKRRRGRVRRNPNGFKGVQKMFSQKILMSTAKAGVGIAIGFAAMPVFYKILPEQLKARREWLGGINLALGLGIAGFIRNRDVKDIGMVIAATGVYDLIAMNVDFLGLPPLRTTSTLAENLIPSPDAPSPAAPSPAAPAPSSEEAASGCYGGQLDISHYGSSYPTSARPVSPVAATGVGASFERMGSSYPSLAYPTVGLSDDMAWDDMIN